nr:pentatricopeptide repeat protein AaPPR955 [Agave angustifolia]UPT49652.1 pentatricopeptide repeat protein AaPPR1073 [Agave angustifolia]
MYAKCGSLACSRQVFDEMAMKNLISWSAMVSGYGLHGKGREAVKCFTEMKEKGIRPDKVTFTSVLSACSHSGLTQEGKEIFHQISSEYNIKPSVEHYACMVDLLGRIGRLDEAYELIMNMEVEPSIDVWAALLSACRIHHNIELGEVAAQKAFDLKPKSVGVHVSLSNIYAKEKRWGDVERVRAAARQNGLRKPPGCTFVELGMTVHRFLVGDKSHPQTRSIYAKLNELREQLKKVGYVADTSSVLYDVEEDVKENMLWDHSERLAIAFSLLNTSPGTIIRITKNLRVCNDCHSATKLISELVGREIVVRDAHRFHHFSNGFCSCCDFW